MKKIFFLTVACSMIASLYCHAMENNADPKVLFEKMTVDFKAKEGNADGMMLHLKFTVQSMKDTESTVAVYFAYSDYHRGVLKDTN